MKIVDLNLLLYAVNRDSPRHPVAKAWLERTLAADEPVGLAWAVLLGFVRIATSSRVFSRPLTSDEAIATVDGWLEVDSVTMVSPGDDHWRIVKDLLGHAGAAGNLTTDAHLAALAIEAGVVGQFPNWPTTEAGAELCSTDADFGRFPKLQWVNPLAS